MNHTFVLTIQCADRPGIVAAVTTELFESGGNIIEAQQFDDTATGQFFMRIEFTMKMHRYEDGSLQARMHVLADKLMLCWKLRPAHEKKRALILVSKHDHCLADLLYRTRIGEMNMTIVGIVGNHPLESLNIGSPGTTPYHYLPVSKETKPDQEAQLRHLIEATRTDLVILARYMQILSTDLTNYLAGRCINIHHSFLPGFKGAQPYHQAHDRGVKIIGATAHYVTGDLDEGPIIEQDVVQVSHSDTPEMLTRKGRDVERRVLSRAVSYHLQDRILINGNKTVVFRN